MIVQYHFVCGELASFVRLDDVLHAFCDHTDVETNVERFGFDDIDAMSSSYATGRLEKCYARPFRHPNRAPTDTDGRVRKLMTVIVVR